MATTSTSVAGDCECECGVWAAVERAAAQQDARRSDAPHQPGREWTVPPCDCECVACLSAGHHRVHVPLAYSASLLPSCTSAASSASTTEWSRSQVGGSGVRMLTEVRSHVFTVKRSRSAGVGVGSGGWVRVRVNQGVSGVRGRGAMRQAIDPLCARENGQQHANRLYGLRRIAREQYSRARMPCQLFECDPCQHLELELRLSALPLLSLDAPHEHAQPEAQQQPPQQQAGPRHSRLRDPSEKQCGVGFLRIDALLVLYPSDASR
jgi:hypothetical protein